MTFAGPFRLGADLLPAGSYQILAEAASIPGLSFDAWYRPALHILVRRPGRTEMRPVLQDTLDRALALDRAASPITGEAAPFPLEDVR